MVQRFWDHLLTVLHTSLLEGAYSLCSVDMQVCFGRLLLKCCYVSPDHSLYGVNSICNYVGRYKALQPLVSCLHYLAKAEVAHKSLRVGEDAARRAHSSKGSLVAAISQKVLSCAKRICAYSDSQNSDKNSSDLLCDVEGVRFGLEAYAKTVSSVRGCCTAWWNFEQLSVFCYCWESCLVILSASDFEKSLVVEVLVKVLDSVGSLVVSAEFVRISSVILDRCLWLAMLPWEQSDREVCVVAGSALSAQQCLLMKRELTSQKISSSSAVKCSSLCALSLFPALVGSAMRLNALLQAYSDVDTDVCVTSIETCAVTLTSLEDDAFMKMFSQASPADWVCGVQRAFVAHMPALLLTASKHKLERYFSDDTITQAFHRTCRVKIPPVDKCADYIVDSGVLSSVMASLMFITEPEIITALVESLALITPFVENASHIHSKCLALFTHGNVQVRNALSCNAELFFDNADPGLCVAELEKHPVIVHLKEAFIIGAKNEDHELQEFAVTTFGHIGRFAKGDLLVTCVIALLKFVLEPSALVRAAAHIEIKQIAAAHHLGKGLMLSQLKEPICQFLVELLHSKRDLASDEKKSNLFRQMCKAFGLKKIKQFCESVRDVLIPMLVCHATPQASQTLKFLAKECDTSARPLLLDSFKHVFLHLVRNKQQHDINTASKFLKAEADFEMTEMLCSDASNILNLLLLYLSTHKDRVLAAVKMIAEVKHSASEHAAVTNLDGEEGITRYLEPHLHGIVAYFNFMLVRLDFFENSTKGTLVISSLIELMKLMGPNYITGVKMKIIAMLRHCLSFKDGETTDLTLSAWKCFIHSVELSSLGPLLGQIVVALSPLVDKHSADISCIFEYLIVENRTMMAPYFKEIYLMAESPALAGVNAVLNEQTQLPLSLHRRLQHVLKGIVHERIDVRLHALKALYKLQTSNKVDLEKCMIGSDTIDPIITDIVTTVLLGLHGCSSELWEEYGKCLGELGAIDPGKLDIPISSTMCVVKFYEIDGDFAVDLLSQLARAYLAATNIRAQDCCAYAIQEVLRIFDCGNSTNASEGGKIWRSLSVEVQEILRPQLNSNYSAAVPDVEKHVGPIFKKSISFQEWIQKWCKLLIHQLEESQPKAVFLPCSLIFQHEHSLALYLLRYILVCLLRDGTPVITNQVRNEVMTVLNHCAHCSVPEQAESTIACAQAIFSALDYLTAWSVGKTKAATVRRVKGHPQKGSPEQVEKIHSFLEGINKDVLAQSAFRCQAYTRALMYLEAFLRVNKQSLQSTLGFLQKIYVALDEPDGVAGVAAVRTAEPSLTELILQYESTGNYRDAAACYERAIQSDPENLYHHEGLLRCMMLQGEFTSALMHVEGLQAKKPKWMHQLNSFRVESSWKLGQWEELETYLKLEMPSSRHWDVNLGRLLLAAKKKDFKNFKNRLRVVRTEQMGPLSTASLEQGSYQRGYDYIVRLHMLQELEDGVTRLMSQADKQRLSGASLRHWHTRFELTQESFRTREPILSLRRVVLGMDLRHKAEIGQYWLKSAQIAQRAGHLQTAHNFLLNAREYSLPEFCLQMAEYKKNQGSSHEALLSLQKAVLEQWPEASLEVTKRNSTHADALLLIGKWMEDTAHYDTQTILKQYKRVIAVYSESEEGHFYLGKYYDRLMSVLASDRPTKSAEFLQFIIRHYGHALEYGSTFIYQCMPRMLTLWLDFGHGVPSSGKRSQERAGLKNTVSQLNDLMKSLMDRLPPYQFLVAFSQLISRICHPNSDVFAQLEFIILKLLKYYPQQALWMMIAVSKSTHADRQSRCRGILERAKRELSDMGKFIVDLVNLSDKLLEVCNKQVEAANKTYSMDKICRGLARLTSSVGFSSIMVPLQSSFTVTLPTASGQSTDHNPFAGSIPTIIKFEDKVEVLPSLQKPKKITIVGSDGNAYILLCKPKDDLRKDARLMEFNSLVNKCLRKDQESRQRRLHIRTFAVIPLNEECGLLEWVSNTHGLRNILIKLYQEKGSHLTGREIRDLTKSAGNDPVRLKEIFLKELLPRHPPVFDEWFLRSFPNPTSWYSSRLAYAHSVAVMSMVGYILGLGDRHGENILFDSTTGDCVHVDFNCLFNKGETFDVPEVVPFRLTHNMVHALGVTGYEGFFRKSSETAMKVLRQEFDALSCVLKTFIHDPLVEWEKVKGKAMSAEVTNEKAVKIIRDIEDRLQGKYPKSKGLPLSIEGHVHALIKEATDEGNLSRMYIGWAPFL